MNGWYGRVASQRIHPATVRRRRGRHQGRRAGSSRSTAPASRCAHALAQEDGRLPHLVKPNAEELAEVTGRSLSTLGDVADAAQMLLARGVRTVLVSLGCRWGPPCRSRPAAATARHRSRAQGRQHGGRGRRIPGRLARRRTGRSARASDALANALRFGATAVEHEGTLLGVPDPRRPVSIGPAAAQTPLAHDV